VKFVVVKRNYRWLKQAMKQLDVSTELADLAVYHYYPPLDKVREWIDQVGFIIEDEGAGSGFHHFLVRKQIT
jgi:hypothetical protein